MTPAVETPLFWLFAGIVLMLPSSRRSSWLRHPRPCRS